MDSPARRLTRLLTGFLITILIVLIFSYVDEGSFFREYWLAPASIAILSSLVMILLYAGRGRPHGEWFTDSWISREDEGEMRSRLENERKEASVRDLGSKWARMEMAHLEEKHSEE